MPNRDHWHTYTQQAIQNVLQGRTIILTREQFQQLLQILETAKEDAVARSAYEAQSRADDEEVEQQCQGIDAVIALLEQATRNDQPPTPHVEE